MSNFTNNLISMLEKAKHSKLQLFILNIVLSYGIPFNRPHGIKVKQITDNSVKTLIKSKRINQNHIRGIHACALATISEFASGLMLLSRLNPAEYRIIMKTIKVDYHYQAKQTVTSTSKLSNLEVLELKQKLENSPSAEVHMLAESHDSENNHICSAFITWQIKKWSAVVTKL
ncbi:MAG: DUF4442 domain-containing protein [Bdellovibrionota bacterium]